MLLLCFILFLYALIEYDTFIIHYNNSNSDRGCHKRCICANDLSDSRRMTANTKIVMHSCIFMGGYCNTLGILIQPFAVRLQCYYYLIYSTNFLSRIKLLILITRYNVFGKSSLLQLRNAFSPAISSFLKPSVNLQVKCSIDYGSAVKKTERYKKSVETKRGCFIIILQEWTFLHLNLKNCYNLTYENIFLSMTYNLKIGLISASFELLDCVAYRVNFLLYMILYPTIHSLGVMIK